MRKIDPDKNPMLLAARRGRLNAKLNSYLDECRPPTDGTSGKGTRRTAGEKIPNLAGFCRSLGCGLSALEELRGEFPRIADYIYAVFEDEALNSIRSPGIWSAHFKDRLGVHVEAPDDSTPVLVFEHDIEEDGA